MDSYKLSIGDKHEIIVDWIKQFFKDKDGPAVIGISGGKDSYVCAYLLTTALGPSRVVGVMMPNGEQKDISDAEDVINFLHIRGYKVDIEPMYKALTNATGTTLFNTCPDDRWRVYETNTPARLRMVTLYGIAAQLGGYVCNTCNRSEDYIGYSTKFGDAAGDFSLLCDLTVREVLELGDCFGLARNLLHKAPSDGMCGKPDEDNLGFTYDVLDDWILHRKEPEDKEVFEKIMRLHNNPNTRLKINFATPHPKFPNFDWSE